MSGLTLTPTQANGTQPQVASQSWLKESVQAFFQAFNWEDQPPEVQALKLNALQGSNDPLSLTLSVQQFFGAINWEGQAIAPAPVIQAEQPPVSRANDLTLDDFSDLF